MMDCCHINGFARGYAPTDPRQTSGYGTFIAGWVTDSSRTRTTPCTVCSLNASVTWHSNPFA